MEAERWQRVVALFGETVGLAEEAREARLAEEAGDDPELLAEVRRLLAAERSAGRFLAVPALAAMPATSSIGRYEILEIIGRGGFGDVYRGFDPQLRRPVAVKTCSTPGESARRRFVREAALAARLDHPNVVAVHDFGTTDDGVPYLVQELLPGEDLAAVLARRERWALGACLDLLAGVARGLAYAHARGVVHRDVKPANLRVLPGGGVKILDFGIARDVAAATAVTASGDLVGTLAYLAPERLRGEAAGLPADVWSFGIVAYELLAGRRPLGGDDGLPVELATVAGRPVPSLREAWPACPRPLARLVDRCLAPAPGDRPEAAILAGELERLSTDLDRQLIPAPSERRARPRGGSRPRRGRLALATATLVIAAGVSWVLQPGLTEVPPPVAVRPGRLLVDARPWGELVAVTDLASNLTVPLPADATTPLALELPPGDYEAVLRHPRADAPARCRARVVAGEAAPCRVVLWDLGPEALLGGET